ncbi:MAG TPA: hypothetical protein VN030_13395 [Cellvibrio sp.]|nr:hypothetical protein [Cellvibrio sp.]
MIIFTSDQPEAIIDQQQRQLLASAETSQVFAVEFAVDQYYLEVPGPLDLLAIVHLHRDSGSLVISATIFRNDPALRNAINFLENDLAAVQQFAWERCRPWLNLSAPLILDPVKIPKPWGQEIWYTGIEARGQSNILAQGFTVPLPWVLALMPRYLAAGLARKITLLKTLDPVADEVYGDLYFELHQQKQEVYIVTHIDSRAWPDGVGAIQLGFCAEKYQQFATGEDFKAAYLAAVKDYEKIRRQIDGLLDESRIAAGIDLTVSIPADTLRQWCRHLPELLMAQEREARAKMNSFVARHSLRLGDVVKVPCLVPHALQHGVRTVEFQTPVYERKILSFAQKVLTQSEWDTEAALEIAQLQTPAQQPLRLLFEGRGVRVEEVVGFADFRVIRIYLEAFQQYPLTAENSYALVMSIGSPCTIVQGDHEQRVAAEVAAFIPEGLFGKEFYSLWLKASSAPVQILVATALV